MGRGSIALRRESHDSVWVFKRPLYRFPVQRTIWMRKTGRCFTAFLPSIPRPKACADQDSGSCPLLPSDVAQKLKKEDRVGNDAVLPRGRVLCRAAGGGMRKCPWQWGAVGGQGQFCHPTSLRMIEKQTTEGRRNHKETVKIR